jgi:multiple sugar transport system permease protein
MKYDKRLSYEKIFPYLLLIPGFIISGIVIIYPLLNGIYMGFTDFSLINQIYVFNSFHNFIQIFTKPMFRLVFFNSLFIVFVSVFWQLTIGLILALLVDANIPGKKIFRSTIFIIWIIPMMVVTLLFFVIFNAEFGIFNYIMNRLNIINRNVAWLGEIWPARIALIITYSWRGIPFFMVLLFAALQTVPQELIEASQIDGAKDYHIFKYITVPFIIPIAGLACLLSSISLFQDITATFIMTNGGPVYATTTVGLYIYKKAFQNFQMGQASAVGTVWLLFMVLLAFLYVKLVSKNNAANW